MTEREHAWTDLERELKQREARISKAARLPHAGPGRLIRCSSCESSYRIVGSGIPDCPHCGAKQA